ncbi:protein SHORT HYPOCOTYL IN WHITE LIGHT 1-like isoform X2 [Macadamia integrifolia]|uniref:protein SHORT HYPOCOTYL IN WHITE LIGHT 1-like isoform X2 n=1 Tax=Macadamia integrifolia TaxID=60698 RepID=UPI001C501425|nr:protein SHORT HYPOCOTYL IN WHITE LIGHT 1-like isoform X2 [Macadamia integrifolia]
MGAEEIPHMASTLTSSSSLFLFSYCRRTNRFTNFHYHHHPHPSLRFRIPQLRYRLRASAGFSNYSHESDNLIADPPHWGATAVVANYYVDDHDSDDDDDEEDRSLDLLVRFLQNMFRKISKRAKKVGFSVNGVIILAFLWFLKAFVEVVCTLGSIVFISILLIRGVWSGLAFIQENRNRNSSNIDDQSHIWMGVQLT